MNRLENANATAGTAATKPDPCPQVEQLLESGVDVNMPDAYGETALHMACMQGQKVVAEMLVVEQMARLDVKNWEGWTPMVWATVRGHTDIVKFLADRVRFG